jgi:hypothetical protein
MIALKLLLVTLLALSPSWSVTADRTTVRVGDTVTQTLTIVPVANDGATMTITTGQGLVIERASGFSGVVFVDSHAATWSLLTMAGVTETLTLTLRVTEAAHSDLDIVTSYQWGDQMIAQPLTLDPHRFAVVLPLVLA